MADNGDAPGAAPPATRSAAVSTRPARKERVGSGGATGPTCTPQLQTGDGSVAPAGPAPSAAPRASHPLSGSCYTAPLLAALAVIGVVVARRPDAWFNPQFWAEDAAIFFVQDRRAGAAAILTPYAGYLHLAPRLIAWLGGLAGPCTAPALYVYASLAGMGMVAARVFSPRLALPAKPWLALVIALVPHQGEVFANPTNLQWVLALLFPLILWTDDPRTLGQSVRDAGLLLFAGLTGPFAILAAPLFAWRWWQRRTWASAFLLFAVAIAAAAQAAYVLETLPSTGARSGPFDPLGFLSVFGRRVPVQLAVGPLRAEFLTVPVVATAGLGLLTLMLWSTLSPREGRTGRLMVWALLLMVVVAATYRDRIDLYWFHDLHNGDRYLYVPRVLLLWLLGVSATRHTWAGRVAFVLCLASVACNARQFRVPPYQDYAWKEVCPRLEAGEPVEVRVNPAGWRVVIPARPAPPR